MKFIEIDRKLITDKYLDIDGCDNLYCLKLNDKTIGLGVIDLRKDNIIDFYIIKEYQGNGYGKILFENLLEKLKEKGYKEITLDIDSENIKLVKIISDFNGLHISSKGEISRYVIPIK